MRDSASVNQNTIGIAFDGSAYWQKALLELDEEVAFHGGLRIVPIISDSALQSVYDLLFLSGVDAAIVRSDVIEFVSRHGGYGRIRNVVNSLSGLGREKLVLVSSMTIQSLDDLDGKIIALGERSSATHMTGAVLLTALGIRAEHRYLSADAALEQLDAGDIDAMLHLVPIDEGKESEQSNTDATASGSAGGRSALLATGTGVTLEPVETAHVLPIEINAELARFYHSETLDATDLPGLIDPGLQIRTVAVDTILAAYRWQADSARHEDASRFTEALIESVAHIREDSRPSAWSAMDLQADIPGVPRLPAVDAVLASMAAEQQAAQEAVIARQRASRIRQLNERRARLMSSMADRADSADTTELQRLLDQLNDFVEALER